MLWSYLLMLLNPAILIAGLIVMAVLAWPAFRNQSQASHLSVDAQDQDDDNDDDGDGWERIDWDAPLDLPPGVYITPADPVPA